MREWNERPSKNDTTTARLGAGVATAGDKNSPQPRTYYETRSTFL